MLLEKGKLYESALLISIISYLTYCSHITSRGRRSTPWSAAVTIYPQTKSRDEIFASCPSSPHSYGGVRGNAMMEYGPHPDRFYYLLGGFKPVSSLWLCVQLIKRGCFLHPTMADRGVDMSALPKGVRDHLAELDLELSEGKAFETHMF